MSLDNAFTAALQPVLAELAEVRQQLLSVQEQLALAGHDLKRPVYDAKHLREELGYSEGEAYNILRAYGHRRNGRMRVLDTNLRRYQEGLPPPQDAGARPDWQHN